MKTGIALIAVAGLASLASAAVYSNNTPIVIPGTGSLGTANPYPSTINISGWTGTVTSAQVRLLGLSHTWPDDFDILLAGPGGAVVLMSDAGGSGDVVNINVTFDDTGVAVPDAGPLGAGPYAPTNYVTGDAFAAPAPAGPYGSSLLAAFNAGANGNWDLFIVDDASGDIGRIDGGWQIELVPAPGAVALLGMGGLLAARRRR
ncbi:MAG: hypothetical protein SFY69_06270 [Planctomycetota bacterium]|nr:hypothetical protein [Planctomycetota bacterium]